MRSRLGIGAGAAIGCCALAGTYSAFAQELAPRPSFLNLRYDEDWSLLRDPAHRSGAWDHLKYMPLGSRDGYYLSLGAEARLRYERFENPGFGSEPQDPQGYYLQRILLHSDLHLGARARLFAQLESSLQAGRSGGPRPTDENHLDLHQAFLDLTLGAPGASLTLRVGRQEIEFGSSRLISTRDGLNTRLAMDAVRALGSFGPWRASAHVFRPVLAVRGVFDDSRDRRRLLWGAYLARVDLAPPATNAVLYYIALDRNAGRFDQGTAPERRHTLGFRLWGSRGAWDQNWEAAFQFGRFGTGSIRGWDIATDNGYTLRRTPGRPRVGLRLDVTSGDADRHEPKLGTFNALFPGTAYSGLAGQIGPANAIDVAPSVSFRPTRRLGVTLGVMRFWRHRLDDGVYGIGINLLRPGNQSSARHIGDQATLQASYAVDPYLTFFVTASYFRAGRFLHETPPGEDVGYVSAWAAYRF